MAVVWRPSSHSHSPDEAVHTSALTQKNANNNTSESSVDEIVSFLEQSQVNFNSILADFNFILCVEGQQKRNNNKIM